MSLIKKVLSSVGIGAAKIDTILEGEEFYPGQEIKGVVLVKGGDVEQKIDQLYFELHCGYEATLEVEQEDRETEIEVNRSIPLINMVLDDELTIKEHDEQKIPFSFNLPYYTPISCSNSKGKSRVWLNTAADIKNAIDPKDRDFIEVIPSPEATKVISAIESLGFKLLQIECEEDETDHFTPLPFVQEFEFKAVSKPASNHFKEIEIIMGQDEEGMDLIIEADRKSSGFNSLLHKLTDQDDEINADLSISMNEMPQIESILESYLFT